MNTGGWRRWPGRLPGWVWVAMFSTLGLPALLLLAYGLDLAGYPATWWRDNPFEYANILHLADTLSWSTRLWAGDPMHLFGWTPHVFYNPLATLLALVFCWPLGLTAGAYKSWLLFVLLLTSLAGYLVLPRRLPGWARAAGGMLAAWATLLVFPGDVGIIDANPVQVLYTGQWAQRLGIFFGMAALVSWLAALRSWRGGPPDAGWLAQSRRNRRAWAQTVLAAFLLGAAIFSHFMSGYAAVAAIALTTVWQLAADFLRGHGGRAGRLALLAGLGAACLLLWFDFFFVLLSLNGDYHSLPLLRWRVAQGAHLVIQEPLTAMFPVVLLALLPLLGRLGDRRRLLDGLFVLVAWVIAISVPVAWLLPAESLLLVLSLLAVRWSGRARLRYLLPVLAGFLWLLACGPDSLQVLGLDLTVLVPFAAALGWAKLAAFARFLWLAWCGLLVAETLAECSGSRRRVAATLAVLALLVPLVLSLAVAEGAQRHFGWMNHGERARTEALLGRMLRVARRVPASGYLLVEDTLHHGEHSLLGEEEIPFGHLPYLIARRAGRPVLGGCVTTRYLTHPLAHTSRGGLLCAAPGQQEEFFAALDRLRAAGVSDLLVHSQGFISALRAYPRARLVDVQAGMAHFALAAATPVVTSPGGKEVAGVAVEWHRDGVSLSGIAPGQEVLLRQVYNPFLRCRVDGGRCSVRPAPATGYRGGNCLADEPGRVIDFSVPWTIAESNSSGTRARLRLSVRPPLWPTLLMLAAWLVLGVACVLPRRPAASAEQRQGD